MSFAHHQSKRDAAESPIVKALEQIGCLVYRRLPSDLLIHRRCWGDGWFRVQEAKSTKYLDKRQIQQIRFLEDTGVKRVLTVDEALEDVMRVRRDR